MATPTTSAPLPTDSEQLGSIAFRLENQRQQTLRRAAFLYLSGARRHGDGQYNYGAFGETAMARPMLLADLRALAELLQQARDLGADRRLLWRCLAAALICVPLLLPPSVWQHPIMKNPWFITAAVIGCMGVLAQLAVRELLPQIAIRLEKAVVRLDEVIVANKLEEDPAGTLEGWQWQAMRYI
ncbi:hypothetical protein RB594_004985 [Gaeumannomyces avenae]